MITHNQGRKKTDMTKNNHSNSLKGRQVGRCVHGV
jgi:hypothetical protein